MEVEHSCFGECLHLHLDRWLFYIEGAMTMLIALSAYFVLPDFPENTTSLTPAERKLAQIRIQEDLGGTEATVTDSGTALSGFKEAMSDGLVWWMAFSLTAQTVGLSFNQYFPTLTATLGYGTTDTLLLCAPPWIFTVVVNWANARHSDKSGERFYHMVGPFVMGIFGFSLASLSTNTGVRYVSL